MPDSHYFREQARTCRKLADVLSNTDTADMFRNMSRDYDSRAEKAERQEPSVMPLNGSSRGRA